MFENKKDEIEGITEAETVVGASVKLKGNLKSDGNITVNGSVSGEIKTKANVNIGSGAEVRASVTAKSVVVSGVVQGNINAEDQLSITDTGKVYGDINVGILSIAPGALFTGKCLMPEEEKVEDVEPVAELEEEIDEQPAENEVEEEALAEIEE